jgi:SNF2-related domain/Helicase conserved C-terminal domain
MDKFRDILGIHSRVGRLQIANEIAAFVEESIRAQPSELSEQYITQSFSFVLNFAFSKEMENRVSAGFVLSAILRVIFSKLDSHILGDLWNLLKSCCIQFETFDMTRVRTGGQKLTAYSKARFNQVDSAFMSMSIEERLLIQHARVVKLLGLSSSASPSDEDASDVLQATSFTDFSDVISSNDIIVDEKMQTHPSSTSTSDRSELKYLGLFQHSSNDSNSSTLSPIGDIVFKLYSQVIYALFDETWEKRHGAFILLREIMISFRECSVWDGVGQNDTQNVIIEDTVLRCIAILCLDSFYDFSSVESSAPVRELASEVLAIATIQLDSSKMKAVIAQLQVIVTDPDWQIRYGSLLGLRAIISSCIEANSISLDIFDSIAKGCVMTLSDSSEEVASVAADVLLIIANAKRESFISCTSKLKDFTSMVIRKQFSVVYDYSSFVGKLSQLLTKSLSKSLIVDATQISDLLLLMSLTIHHPIQSVQIVSVQCILDILSNWETFITTLDEDVNDWLIYEFIPGVLRAIWKFVFLIDSDKASSQRINDFIDYDGSHKFILLELEKVGCESFERLCAIWSQMYSKFTSLPIKSFQGMIESWSWLSDAMEALSEKNFEVISGKACLEPVILPLKSSKIDIASILLPKLPRECVDKHKRGYFIREKNGSFVTLHGFSFFQSHSHSTQLDSRKRLLGSFMLSEILNLCRPDFLQSCFSDPNFYTSNSSSQRNSFILYSLHISSFGAKINLKWVSEHLKLKLSENWTRFQQLQLGSIDSTLANLIVDPEIVPHVAAAWGCGHDLCHSVVLLAKSLKVSSFRWNHETMSSPLKEKWKFRDISTLSSLDNEVLNICKTSLGLAEDSKNPQYLELLNCRSNLRNCLQKLIERVTVSSNYTTGSLAVTSVKFEVPFESISLILNVLLKVLREEESVHFQSLIATAISNVLHQYNGIDAFCNVSMQIYSMVLKKTCSCTTVCDADSSVALFTSEYCDFRPCIMVFLALFRKLQNRRQDFLTELSSLLKQDELVCGVFWCISEMIADSTDQELQILLSMMCSYWNLRPSVIHIRSFSKCVVQLMFRDFTVFSDFIHNNIVPISSIRPLTDKVTLHCLFILLACFESFDSNSVKYKNHSLDSIEQMDSEMAISCISSVLLTFILPLLWSNHSILNSHTNFLLRHLMRIIPLDCSLGSDVLSSLLSSSFLQRRKESIEVVSALRYGVISNVQSLPVLLRDSLYPRNQFSNIDVVPAAVVNLIPTAIQPRVTLRQYQLEGISWLLFLQKFSLHGILADDMGLGKTIQSLTALAIAAYLRKDTSSSSQSLIICPSILAQHWKQECFQYFGNIKIDGKELFETLVIEGNASERSALWHSGMKSPSQNLHRIFITSYNYLRNDIDKISGLLNVSAESSLQNKQLLYLILDEGHLLSNEKSAISKACQTLGQYALHRLILTGTPIQNNISDIYPLFQFLMPGYLGQVGEFQEQFGNAIKNAKKPSASETELEKANEVMSKLHKLVLPFILRRLKCNVLKELPPKILLDILIPLSEVQRNIYDRVDDDPYVFPNIDEENDGDALDVVSIDLKSSELVSKMSSFTKLHSLRSIVNHLSLISGSLMKSYQFSDLVKHNENDVGNSCKLVALKELLIELGICISDDEQVSEKKRKRDSKATDASSLSHEKKILVSSQNRALIFAHSSEFLALICKHLLEPSRINFLVIDSTCPSEERFKRAQEFNRDPKFKVLLCTLQLGSLGLNLTGANNVIFMELSWNPMRDLQAMDRTHRLGQKNTVMVYRIITTNTFEQRVMSLQKFKQHMASTVISQDNASISTMLNGDVPVFELLH